MAAKKKSQDIEEFMFDEYIGNALPMIGEQVTDREFEIYHKEKFSNAKLSNYRGKWLVLFFYPKDFTYICPTELEDMQEHYAQLKKMGVEVVSVSTDTVVVHKAWHDNSEAIGKITFPMAADPTGTLSRDFGVHIEAEGVTHRGTFIINPKGELVAYEVHNDDIGRNVDELVRKIQAAQFVATHKGKVCPAKWTPGSATLKPGIDLVGKI